MAWWSARTANTDSLEIPIGIVVINPVDVFCETAYCLAGEEGNSYYFDDHHMSVRGAERVASKINEILQDVQ